MTTIKRFLTLSLIAALAMQVWGVPAYRGWQTKTQPDGSTITIRQTGDEFFHYWENEEGQQVAKDAQGFWRVLETPAVQSEVSKQKQASRKYNQRGGDSKIRKAAGQINLAPRGLVILVNYSDVTFRSGNTQAAMSDLMNSENYTYNDATGSVREFFKAQSNGAYVPDFDVVGPYTLANNRAHYGGNDSGGDDLLAGDMIVEACKAADADGVDFTLYNNDGDSYVDFVYVIYAGEGEADSDEDDAIWPHNWTISSARYYNNCSYSASQSKVDGLYIENYACSGELRGRSTTRCPIGTIAHEFGHVLGLPDYYVTSKSAANYPHDYTPGAWHIMDYGSYNNDGRTPPNYSPHDKYFFGWSTPTLLAKDEKKNCTLTTTYGSAYQITGGTTLKGATASDRVWYLENRQKSGWDKYLPGHGMVVWEVQYNSSNWTGNTPNNTSVGYTVVTANSLTRPYEPYVDNTTASSTSGTTFPGTSNVTSYTPATGCALTNITESAGNITFKYNGGVSSTTWDYTLYGDHCTYPADGTVLKNAALNLTINPASGYTLANEACWEVTMGGTPLTYGTGFTYNSNTGAFSIASVTGDVEILVEGKRTVTWNVAGLTSTTYFSEGAALVLPSKPEDCSGVGGKKFVGWTANSSVDGSAPADLFTAAGTKTVTANTTYYAVYATASGSGGSSKTYNLVLNGNNFAGSYNERSSSATANEVGGTGTLSVSFTSNGVMKSSNSGNPIQFRKSSSGAGVLYNTTDLGTINSITYGSGSTNNIASTYKGATEQPTSDGTGGYFKITNGSSVSYITSITINFTKSTSSGTTYSDYSLMCTTCTLSSIALNTSGATTVFTQGDAFSAEGLVVTASYSDCANRTVSPTSVSSPDMSITGVKTITVSYTEGGETKSQTYNITVNAAPTYKIRFYDGDTKLKEEDLVNGATATPPSNPAGCSEYTFYGWWTEKLASSNTTAHKVTDFTVSGAQDYYAVYSHTVTSGGGAASLTKQGSTSSFAAGDNIVIVAKSTTYALYQETVSTSYVKNWSFENSASTVGADAKNYVTLATAATSGKWYLGDATNGYLYNTSGGNELYVKTDGSKAEWTISWDAGQSAFTVVGGRNLSCRTDLTGSNANKYRSANGTGTGTCYFDIYKYSAGGGSTTYYTGTAECVECTNKVTLSKGTPEHGSFNLDKADGEHNNCSEGGLVVTVSGITPAEGYEFGEITQTGIASGVTIDQAGKTVTYAKDVKGASTINVTFTEKPTYAIRFFNNGVQVGTTQNLYAGQVATKPTPDPTACEGYTFVGWWTAALATDNTTAETWVTDFTVSGAQDYYAVYSHSDGGGSSTVTFTPGTDVGETTVTKGGVTCTLTTMNNASYYQIYASNTGTFSVASGNITSIAITCTASGTVKYGPGNISASPSGYTYSGMSGTWSGSASSVSFTGSQQVRMTSIVVTVGGGGTTYYTTAPECVECTNKVTLSKGEESNGTFTLDKANGEYNNCTSNFVVTVSGITPASGYYCTGVTATGDHNTVTGPDGSGNYTVSYNKGNNITSTITANFAPNPKYTVTWSMNGDESYKVQYEEGESIAFPGTATGCDGKVFRGWSAETVAETDVEPSYVTSATMPAHNVTYYAVYAEESGSGGTPSSESYAFTNSSWNATGGNWTSGKNGAGYNNSGVQVTTGASGANATCPTSYSDISSIVVSYCTNGSSGAGSITMGIGSTSLTNTITKTGGTTARNTTFDFSGTTPTGNPRITVTCTTNSIYICGVTIYYGSSATYTGYTTTCGAGISAKNIGWITTTKGQKVKRVINVSAKNFDEATTLAATCANSHFAVTLGATDVPAGPAGLTTTLTVEYTPTAQGREENVEIELTAGDKSRTITVSGRCVPDEFLLITKKSSTWYALPANMATSGEHDGIEVSPNDATTPTVVPVSPSNAIYSLASVANSRYADNGHCVRLVGNDNLCLWSNMATSTTKTYIQNKTQVATAATDNHDWLLSTTDGVHYTIANPHHPHYGDGRILAFGTKFGMYIEDTEFFIVSAGCSSQPGEVTVSPRRVEATFSWVSNASSMTIDLYTNELMTEGHLTATASSSPYVFTGLEESKPYWYKLTPGTDIDCAVTGSFITTGPIVDIVEWQENGVVLYIDKGDITPLIVIDGQEEHGSISGGGGNATELFFAKYFEGAGSMKLVSVFNGTNNDINLSDYSIFVRMRGGSGSWAPGSDVTLDLGTLGSIKAGQEIIFFSRPVDTETALEGCSSSFLDDKVNNHSSVESNPRWVECGSTLSPYSRINFNGNDPILLKKSGSTIDIIGSEGAAPTATNCLSGDSEKGWGGTVRNMDKGKSPSHPDFDAFYEASSQSPVSTQDSIDLLTAFGINLADDEIPLTTARCIFFRDKRITCGDSAVLMNGSTFVTFMNHDEFKSEWYGRSVCMNTAAKTAAGVSDDAQATCNSYQDIANMDYNEYYIDWTNIDPGTALTEFTHDLNTNEYTIPIDNMRQHACLNLRFQLVHEGNVLTEATQQVPIVVVGDVDTNDPLFSELVEDKTTHEKLYPQSLARCKDCDVVVLGAASLTKGSNTDPKDVPEVGNVKVYPGGKLVVPTGTNYTMKSLALRRQEDAVASADVQGTITFSAPAPAPARKDVGEKPIRKTPTGTKKTYFDLRVDPTNWHYISLPYDCDVADIRYANPQETDVPVLGTDYLIKWYNGEKRAATQSGGCWEMVAADATLKAGLGYIFSIPGEGSVRREFRFPMDNEVVTLETADKLVNSVYGYGCDKELTEVRANHRGWNLLGNPYMLPYTTDITTPLETGLIVEDHSTDPWDGHFKFDETSRTNNLRYIVEPINNGWSGYTQVTIEDYPMTPFTSYFVQVGAGDPMDPDPEAPQGINFHVAKVNHSPVRRAPAEYEELEDRHPVWCAVTLTNPKGEKDETTLLISDNFTDGYDMMDDLTKWRGTYYQYAQITTAPVLASRNNEGEMAFNALPDSSALAGVPLNYFAASQGFYTFAYDDKYDRDMEVKEVKLWDKTTNQWYDLMNEPYSFSTARTDNKDRFVLSVRVERKHNQTTTDLENAGTYRGDKPRKLLINGLLYIQRGKDVYDVTGKQLLNR